MAASSRVLRSTLKTTVTTTLKTSVTTKPYIGSPQSDVPPGKLPALEDVLRVFAFLREQPAAAKKPIDRFCCHITRTKESQCNTEEGCVASGKPCLLYLIKLPFIEAGIVTISDYSIMEKLKSVSGDYSLLLKIVNRESESATQTKEKYMVTLGKTFDITDFKAREIIANDEQRSGVAKREDLLFFDDYFSENATRKMTFTIRDTRYDNSVREEEKRRANKQTRKEVEERRSEKEKDRLEQQDVSQDYDEEHDGENNDYDEEHGGENNDPDWEDEDDNENVPRRSRGRRRKQGKRSDGDGGGGGGDDDGDEDGMVAKIPFEILGKTAATALRLNLSPEQHFVIAAAFLKCSGVDLSEYPVSYGTAVRRRKEQLTSSYHSIREKFRQEVDDEDDCLFVHLDTKSLGDTIGPHGSAVTNTR